MKNRKIILSLVTAGALPTLCGAVALVSCRTQQKGQLYSITAKANKELTDNDTFSPNCISVEATYKNGDKTTTETVDVNKCDISCTTLNLSSPFTFRDLGDHKLTISYNGKTTTCTLVINPAQGGYYYNWNKGTYKDDVPLSKLTFFDYDSEDPDRLIDIYLADIKENPQILVSDIFYSLEPLIIGPSSDYPSIVDKDSVIKVSDIQVNGDSTSGYTLSYKIQAYLNLYCVDGGCSFLNRYTIQYNNIKLKLSEVEAPYEHNRYLIVPFLDKNDKKWSIKYDNTFYHSRMAKLRTWHLYLDSQNLDKYWNSYDESVSECYWTGNICSNHFSKVGSKKVKMNVDKSPQGYTLSLAGDNTTNLSKTYRAKITPTDKTAEYWPIVRRYESDGGKVLDPANPQWFNATNKYYDKHAEQWIPTAPITGDKEIELPTDDPGYDESSQTKPFDKLEMRLIIGRSTPIINSQLPNKFKYKTNAPTTAVMFNDSFNDMDLGPCNTCEMYAGDYNLTYTGDVNDTVDVKLTIADTNDPTNIYYENIVRKESGQSDVSFTKLNEDNPRQKKEEGEQITTPSGLTATITCCPVKYKSITYKNPDGWVFAAPGLNRANWLQYYGNYDECLKCETALPDTIADGMNDFYDLTLSLRCPKNQMTLSYENIKFKLIRDDNGQTIWESWPIRKDYKLYYTNPYTSSFRIEKSLVPDGVAVHFEAEIKE